MSTAQAAGCPASAIDGPAGEAALNPDNRFARRTILTNFLEMLTDSYTSARTSSKTSLPIHCLNPLMRANQKALFCEQIAAYHAMHITLPQHTHIGTSQDLVRF